ncbi:MAG: hypothetical protein ACLUQ1_07605, partial [Faecalibacterium prausnitzii]
KRKPAPRHQRENQLKEKTALPLARAERKPLDQKRKPAPRHQRENQLKEKTSPALWPARSAKPFDRKRKLPRATGARTSLKKKPALPLARAERIAI